METNDYCIWYTDKLKKINNKLWYPSQIINNDTFKYKFNSQIINFESFKPVNNNNNNLKIKKYELNNYRIEYKKNKLNYFNKIINLCIKNLKESKEYLKQDLKQLIEKENKNIYGKFCARMNKSIMNHKKSLKLLCKSIHCQKIKLNLTNEQKGLILKWMDSAEKVYNFCVNEYNNNNHFPSNFISGKKYVFNHLYKNIDKDAPYDILSYEIKDFFSNLQSCYTNSENNNIKFFVMKNKNIKKNQTITIYKNCISKNGIYSTILGKIKDFDKLLNIYDIICDCKLSYEKITNNFYFYIPQYIDCKNNWNNRKDICAIDPGGERGTHSIYILWFG